MFGHDNHHEESNLPEPDGALVSDHSAPQVNGSGSADGYIDDVPPATPSVTAPVTPTDNSVTTPAATDNTTDDATAPAVEPPAQMAAPAAAPAPSTPVPDTDKLLDIKQQALQQLTPLVGHLEQTPEEKFRTTMMMIQASDNHELVGTAYEAAQQITDEKVRAQALLDIVNEINYFTHSGTEAEAEAA